MSWTDDEIETLKREYPVRGKMALVQMLGKTEAAIRGKASKLGLKLDQSSEFWMEFQLRAGQTKVGRKRPDQSLVMKSLHAAGKLRATPAMRIAMSVRQKKWIAENGHPRGALGMVHTPEALAKIADASRRNWAMKTPEERRARDRKALETRAKNGTMSPDKRRGSWKSSWRVIGGKRKFYRSRWEANYARFLQWQKERGDIQEWAHEPETFWFDGVKRGCVSYLPDFRVTTKSGAIEYHEVKGWMDARSATKIKRMKKYHPTVRLIVVDGKAYGALAKMMCKAIPNWE